VIAAPVAAIPNVADVVVLSKARLKAKLWVQATLRTCMVQEMTATIVHKGDEDAGAVLIKQNLLGAGFCILTQIRSVDGELVWLRATGQDPVPESMADDYIVRQRRRDRDLWVIEIEDRQGRLPFETPVRD